MLALLRLSVWFLALKAVIPFSPKSLIEMVWTCGNSVQDSSLGSCCGHHIVQGVGLRAFFLSAHFSILQIRFTQL